MLYAGSDDGVYRISDLFESTDTAPRKVLDAGRVTRVRQFDGVDGLFAATETGLYHTFDGEEWTDLRVPGEQVTAVVASTDGDTLYAGTRPAHVYATRTLPDGSREPDEGDWEDLEGFQDLPSRDEWGLERHDYVATVRSLGVDPGSSGRLVAGVEVGGVHVSDDGGATWGERRTGVNDDVHHLHVVGDGEFLASTGFGLYRTVDAGRSWTRLDEDHPQRYFREAFSHDGAIYAGGGTGSSSTWEDESENVLFESRDGRALEPVETPTPSELVIGWCSVGDDVVGVTHRGSLLVESDGEWTRAGSVPVPGNVGGRYLPLAWFEG